MSNDKLTALEAECTDLKAVVGALIVESETLGLDLNQVLAAYVERAFQRGVRMGVHMRCEEITAGLIATRADNPGAAHIHSDACLLDTQQIIHRAIPGIIELPELIADYGHQSFAAGYLQGIEESQEPWGDPEEQL